MTSQDALSPSLLSTADVFTCHYWMSLTLVLSLYALFFPFYSQPNRTADQGLFLLKKIKFIWIQIDLYKDATNPKNNNKKKKGFLLLVIKLLGVWLLQMKHFRPKIWFLNKNPQIIYSITFVLCVTLFCTCSTETSGFSWESTLLPVQCGAEPAWYCLPLWFSQQAKPLFLDIFLWVLYFILGKVWAPLSAASQACSGHSGSVWVAWLMVALCRRTEILWAEPVIRVMDWVSRAGTAGVTAGNSNTSSSSGKKKGNTKQRTVNKLFIVSWYTSGIWAWLQLLKHQMYKVKALVFLL